MTKGRIYYGTTAGTFHILDCKDGKVVKTVNIGWPIVSASTFANDAIYFQALDSVVRCLDLDGNEKWKWEHYKQYRDPSPNKAFDKYVSRPHYGGGDVVVSGTRVITSVEWDLLCLEDKGQSAAVVWCQRCPWLPDALTMSSSISGDYLYTVGVNADGGLYLRRFAIKDGTTSKETSLDAYSYWITPAVRGSMVAASRQHSSFLYDWEAKKVVARLQDVPGISSCTLAKGHCVMTTLNGELVASEITPGAGAKPFRAKLPSGKGIGSSPVLSGGCVFFGCDDGCLYVYGPGGVAPAQYGRETYRPRAEEQGAAGNREALRLGHDGRRRPGGHELRRRPGAEAPLQAPLGRRAPSDTSRRPVWPPRTATSSPSRSSAW